MEKHSSVIELILGSVPPDQRPPAKAVTRCDAVSTAIILVTSITAAFLPFLRQIGDGAFVVCIMFAFSCAFSAILLHRKPPAAKLFRFAAIVCLSTALVVNALLTQMDKLKSLHNNNIIIPTTSNITTAIGMISYTFSIWFIVL